MKIKRYEGVSETAIVQQVKDELGPQAIIVSIKSVRARGFFGAFRKPRIEVMAAYDESGEGPSIVFDGDGAVPVTADALANSPPVNVNIGKSVAASADAAPVAGASAAATPAPATNPAVDATSPAPSALRANALKENQAFAAGLKDAYKDRLIEEQAGKIKMLENSVASAQEMLTRLSGKLSVERHKTGKTDKRYKNNVIQVIFETMLEQGVREQVAASVLDGLDYGPDPEAGIDIGDIVKMVYTNIMKIIGRTATDYEEHKSSLAAEEAALAAAEEAAAAIAAEEAKTDEANPAAPKPRKKPALGKNPLDSLNTSGIKRDNKPFVAVFLGPTGVGKTTTLAKLSADFALSKQVKLSLISADTYRIAAVEQLRTYADILGVELGVVYNPEDFAKMLDEMGDESEVILVDTAGRSHKHKEHMEEMVHFLSVAEDCHRYLVLSLTTKFEDMLEIVETYAHITDFKLIFTKLDETKTMGAVLNLCYATGKAVSYITFGQNVPSDIRPLYPEEIARTILSGT